MINIKKLSFAVDTLIKFEERINRNEEFIGWGEDNLFVNFLYDSLNLSPIHNSCIRKTVDNAVGMGYINDYKINSKDYLNDVAKSLYFELITTGNLFLEIVWKKDRSEGISGFYLVPSKYMRIGKPKEMGEPATHYYYSRDWANWRKAGIVKFSEFDPMNFTDRQIVHIRQYQPGLMYYGAPNWLSVANDIRLNHEITVYNLANLINGANPSLWVHFNVPAPDSEYEQNQIIRNIEDRYVGSNNTGRVVVSYGDSSERPEITQISSNLQQGFYSEVFELVQHQILAGNGINDPSIIGLPTRTGFSSSADQLETSFKLFMNTTISPLQKFVNRELKPLIELVYPGEEINLEITNNNIL